MARNMEFGIVVGASVTGALTGFSKIAQGLKNVKEKTEELSKTAKKLEAFDQASKKMIAINKEYSKAVEHLKMLQEAQKKAGASGHLLNDQIKKQEQVINNLNKQKERQNHVFKAARSSIEQEGYTLKGYKKNLEKVNKELLIQNRLKEIQSKHESRISNLDKLESQSDKYLKRGAVAGAMTLAPLKIYMDVEESQADLRKMLGNEAQKYYGKLREISDNSPLSQVQVFEIAGSLAQSGIDGKDLVEYTKKANQIAVAFDMGTQEAGEFLAKTKAQLNLGTKELFAYADTINYLSDNTASKANQIVEISQRVASLGGIAGVSKESVAAFGATLVSAGVAPERASTGLKNLYVDLSKGTSATKGAQEAFKNLGLSAEQLAVDMQKNGEGTILKVLSKIKQMPKELQTATINQIFGQEAIDSVSGLVNNLDMLETNLKKSKSAMANGAVEAEYKNRMNTLTTQLKVFKNQLMNSFADLGLALAPSIRQVLKEMTPMIHQFAKWIREHPKLTTIIMKTIGAFALFNLALGGVLKFGTPVIKMFLGITNVFSKLKAAGGLIQGFSKVFPMASKLGSLFSRLGPLLTNPWVLAGVVITGIFVLLYKKSTWFRNGVNKAMKEIMPYIKQIGSLLKNAIGKSISYVGNLFKKHGPGMKKIFESMKPVLSVFGNIIKIVVIAALKSLITNIKLILTVAKAVFQNITNSVRTAVNLWKGMFKLVVAVFTGDWKAIPGIVAGIWNTIKSGISGFIGSFKTMFSGLFTWFKDKWNDIKSTASSFGNVLNPMKWGKNASGTNYWSGGLTSVAERGAELVRIPGQSPFLAQHEMMLNLPRGTQILNNSQTRSNLRGRVSNLKERVNNLKSGNNYGGITINVNVSGDGNPIDIAREVKKVMKEFENKKRRVDI